MLGLAEWTISRWVRAGKFPKPVYLTEHSPATWRLSTVEAFIAKRSVARRKPPTPRGALRPDFKRKPRKRRKTKSTVKQQRGEA